MSSTTNNNEGNTMKNTTGMYNLTVDAAGQSRWIDREAEQMGPEQKWRELVKNGQEAGATEIIIDGWDEPDTGRSLLRFTDNGSGMSEAQLKRHMSTLHMTGKSTGSNYGIGARIASLYYNPAGVEIASRKDGDEAQVTLIRERGLYGLRDYPVTDEFGQESKAVVIAPDEGILKVLGKCSSGTTVVLRGDGKSDTYSQDTFNRITRYLSQRFYSLEGTRVRAFDGRSLRPISTMGQQLEKHSTASGEVGFRDVDGQNGTIHWWIWPKKKTIGGRESAPGGVGVLLDSEIFSYSPQHSMDYGLIYKNVAARVTVLVEFHGAKMDTGRSGVVLPRKTSGSARTNIPWRAVGKAFIDNMPAEVRALLESVRPAATSIDDEIAAALDKDWFKRVQPVAVPDPAKDGDDMRAGVDEGADAVAGSPATPEPDSPESPEPPTPRKVKPAKRTQDGDDRAGSSQKRVTPKCEFFSPEQYNGPEGTFVCYEPNQNLIMVRNDVAPYVRAVEYWKSHTHHAQTVVEDAVRTAYGIELGAHIIDANGQVRHSAVTSSMVEEMKSPGALYGKLLGVQSIEKTIEQRLVASARSAE